MLAATAGGAVGGSLVIFDLGYTNFTVFAQLTAAQVTWLTRAESNLAMKWNATCSAAPPCMRRWSGSVPNAARQLVRLISVLYHARHVTAT